MRSLCILLCFCLLGTFCSAALNANDQAALNFALALKRAQLGIFDAGSNTAIPRTINSTHLISLGLQNFTMQDFINVGYNVTIYEYLTIIEDDLKQQADNISSVLTTAGFTPLGDCTYNNDSLTSPEAFLIESRKLCNIVLSGITGLHSTFADNDALTLIASGHSVAGRHCAYLNLISGVLPFPSAHETATDPQSTQTALQPYIDSCPFTLTLPTPRRASSAASHVVLAASLLVLPALHFIL